MSLQPHNKMNLLLGDNGAGKTTILEAIHLLSLARSFRTRTLKQLIQFQCDHYQIVAKTTEHQTPIGLQYDQKSGLTIRLNNAPLKKRSDLAQELPLQFIPANSHQFFENGPKYRRQLLDWGLFHVEPNFNFHWQSYKKIVQQRNSALKQKKQDKEIQLWDAHLILHGNQIHQFRLNRLTTLLSAFNDIFPRICQDFGQVDFKLKYRPGWPKEITLEEILSSSFERDKQLGYTKSGIHAADWSFRFDDYEPNDIFSRGQQKLFFIALCMAQIKTTQQARASSILLIDDLSSELDKAHQQKVLTELLTLNVQTYITSTNESLVELFKKQDLYHAFHVKQGEIVA